MKTFVGILKKICIGIFLIFTIIMTVLLLNFNKYGVTQFDETSLVIVKKSFASETYKRGSLVVVESKKIADYKEGEEVFVYHLDGKGGADIVLGTVGKTYPEQDAITFTNGGTYSSEFIIGTGEKTYENIGTILSIIESKWGFLFIILVPNFFLFIYQLYSLIVEIKYGKDEE